jgi:putative two-component system response regulator
MSDLPTCTILAVDDTKYNLDLLVDALGEKYDLSVAMSGAAALQLAEVTPPNLILLDLMMPGMDGFEVLRRLKANATTREIPVILLTALSEIDHKAKGFELGAVDYITKPFQIEEVVARVNTHLKLRQAQDDLKQFNSRLQEMVAKQVEEIAQSQHAMIFALAKLSHTRDDDTGLHLERVQHLCKILAKELAENDQFSAEVTPVFIDAIYHASPLHDVGKVGIIDSILLKPGKLSEEEFLVMKTHTTIGAATLEAVQRQYPNNAFIEMGIDIARHHHEKWDGSGYPDRLAGETIPLSARIMALVDVYDALRARRPYKEPFSHDRALTIIREESGRMFDPQIVQAFWPVQEQFDQVCQRLTDSSWLARTSRGASWAASCNRCLLLMNDSFWDGKKREGKRGRGVSSVK